MKNIAQIIKDQEERILSEIAKVANPQTIDNEVPELPNLITFIYRYFEGAPWAKFLHRWEAVVFSLLLAAIMSLVFYFGTRKRELIPSGFQNFLEFLIENLRSLIVGIIGPQGEKHVPFLGTLFIYILAMNIAGLIPLMKSPSSNLNITAALAICVFFRVQYLNIKNMGLLGFLYHLAGSPKNGLEWALVPLMLPLELLTQFSRPITLALRLFGNVLGEDILIGAFALFGLGLVANFHSPVGLPLQIPFMFLAILTGFMQALVFTLLSSVYILLSIPHHEETHTH